MEGVWRHTRRMDPARSERICSHFINGSCRLGPRCSYRHEWPVSAQLCRYFPKGGCWYGERCRYRHVLQPEVDAAVSGRRSSVPAVSSSSVACAPSDRRGSEPSLLQAEVTSRQECSRPEDVVNTSNNVVPLAAAVAVGQSKGTNTHLSGSWELNQNSEVAQTCDGKTEQETSPSGPSEGGGGGGGAAAVVPNTHGKVGSVVSLKTNMNCGICMDNVYEKKHPNNIFGILPNCNHSFCKKCISTWRKMRDYGPDVVKSCPQCRVRSAFYAPSKSWVEGQAKESLIAAFKERFSKKSCRYYMRYGRCPFKSECLYLHDKRARCMSLPYHTEDEDDYAGVDLLNLFIAMTLLGGDDDDDDDLDFPFYLAEDYGF